MEVHFTPEQEAQIAEMATKFGAEPERLVKDVLVRYLDDEARFLAAVEKGIAAAERGEISSRSRRVRRKDLRTIAPGSICVTTERPLLRSAIACTFVARVWRDQAKNNAIRADTRIRVEQVSCHRWRTLIEQRRGRSCPLVGAGEGGIVDANGVEKMFRPTHRFDRLQNHGVAFAANGYREGLKTKFLRQRNGLTGTRFHNVHSLHGIHPDGARLPMQSTTAWSGRKGSSTIEVREMGFEEPWSAARLVIATRPVN